MPLKNFIIPIFIPELACPFQCLYCNQQKISGQLKLPSDTEIIKTIDKHLQTIPDNSHIELGYFGGNFTAIPAKDQQHYLELVQPYINAGKIKSIRCSTRPDYINEEVLDLLSRYNVKNIEIGAQSFDDDVLLKSGRGHNVLATERASTLIKKYGFSLGLQMMIGLPGDTKEKALKTAHRIIELKADNTRIYPTLVIKDTKLEELYNKGFYHPLSLHEAIDWTADIIKIFEKSKVTILRVGLHASDGFMEGHDLIAGPFHPSFRELVYTQIWRKQFESLNFEKEELIISINPKELNYAVGYGSVNKKWLKGKYKVVKFVLNSNLEKRAFHVNYSRQKNT